MKVMCVNDVSETNGKKYYWLHFGEVYEAIGEKVIDGIDCFEIVGLPTTVRHGRKLDGAYYSKTKFVPLSDIDERELVNELLETKTS